MLKSLGRWATRLVHGNRRGMTGLLLTRHHYLEDEQEWRLGQSYLGLLGFAVFLAIWLYVWIAYADAPRVGKRIHLGHWDQLGLDLKILLPLAVAGHLFGMVSAVRAWLVWQEIAMQSRAELGE